MIFSTSLYLETVFFLLNFFQKVQTTQNGSQCIDIVLLQNEKFCELRNLDNYLIGQTSDNLTDSETFQNYDGLIHFTRGPNLYQKDDIILITKYREQQDQDEICSLISNFSFDSFFLSCISTQTTFIIDNSFQLPIQTQYKISIEIEQNFNCSYFDYHFQGFIIYCYSKKSLKIYNIFKEEDYQQQKIIFQSEIQLFQCRIKFHAYSNQFIIIYYDCQTWKIQIYENYTFKFQIDPAIFKVKFNTEGILLDVISCYNNLLILLSSGGFQYYLEKYILLFVAENLNLNEILIQFNSNCQAKYAIKAKQNNYFRSTFPAKFDEILFNTKNFPNQIMLIQNPTSVILKYEDQLIIYVNKFINQSINLKLNNLIQLQNQNIYIGIGEGNQINLIKITYKLSCFLNYDQNQKQPKYYISYFKSNLAQNGSYFQCYRPIFIKNEESINEYAMVINLENEHQYIQRANFQEQFKITFLRSSFSSSSPSQIKFNPLSKQIQLSLTNTQIKCQFIHQLKYYNGTFIIRTRNNQVYSIIVQGNEKYIYEYICENEKIRIQHIVLDLNQQKIHKNINSNFIMLLDQQQQCLYQVQIEDLNHKEIMTKIMCLTSQVEKIFGLNNHIVLKLKDQEVFYNLIYSNAQINLKQYDFPKHLNLNFLDILFFKPNLYIVVYEKQLHVIFNQTTVQIINTTCQILGSIASPNNWLVTYILLNREINQLQFYLLSITEFTNTKNYNLKEYIPIQPLQFKIFNSLIIISSQHKINKKYYLLILNNDVSSSLYLLQQVIEIRNQHFWTNQYNLYYFDDKNHLAVYNLMDINLEIYLLETDNRTSQDFVLQVEIQLENTLIPSVKQELMIKLINPSIINLITNNTKYLFRYENQEINFRDCISGKIDNIFLSSNEDFRLIQPFEKQVITSCLFSLNKFCFQVNNSEYIVFFKVETLQQTYLVYNYKEYFSNLLFIELIMEDEFLLLNQINIATYSISLVQLKDNVFTLKKQLNTDIHEDIEQIILEQIILIIQTKSLQQKFLINNHEINQWDTTDLIMVEQIKKISSKQYVQISIKEQQQIFIINIFSINNSVVIINHVFEIYIKNSKIKDLIIGNISSLSGYFMKFIKSEYNQVKDQLDLILYLFQSHQYNLNFVIRLYLKEQRFEFLNIKMIRFPKCIDLFNHVLISDKEIIIDCGFNRYLYDLKHSEFVFDPIYSTQDLIKIEILNNTHYLFQKYIQYNQSNILYVGQRGGYFLQRLSQNNKQPTYLQFKAIDTDLMEPKQVNFNLEVIQIQIENNLSFYISLILLIIIVFIITALLIIVCKRRKIQKQSLTKIAYPEISLAAIRKNDNEL